MYSQTTYPLDTPDPLWERFKSIHEDEDRFNDPLLQLVAEDVVEHVGDDLDEDERAIVSAILGVDVDDV